MTYKKDTTLVHAGRRKAYTGNLVNPMVARASTIVFDSIAAQQNAEQHRNEYVDSYGRRGTTTSYAFKEAMCELEGAAACYLYPCGTAAITSCLLVFASAGDHILVVDSVYQPTRFFCDGTLSRMGVEVEYYDPLIGENISSLIRHNTRLIFLESPGSLTMEVQDIPAIVKAAQQHEVITMIDNTYASPLNLRPLDFGIDISIHSATKYLNGHSDIMLGVASANEQHATQLIDGSYELGHCASPDDVYTTLRGLRTLSVRMRHQAEAALDIAQWLERHELVDHVRHPALASCPGSTEFLRDYQGNSSLFSFVLNADSQNALAAMIDNMEHFALGYSWGGYESLILANRHFEDKRTTVPWQAAGPVIRVSIGLEDVDDLKQDLSLGLQRYKENL